MNQTTYKFKDDLFLHVPGDRTVTVWSDGAGLTPDTAAEWTMGDTPTPSSTPAPPMRWYTPNVNKAPVDWEGATIGGHESPGWLTAAIVVTVITGSALISAYGFLWVAGRMLRAVGV